MNRDEAIAGLAYLAACLSSNTPESDEIWNLVKRKTLVKICASAFKDKNLRDKFFPPSSVHYS